MRKLLTFLRCKPLFFLGITIAYVVFLYLIRWNIHPTVNAVLFVLGSSIGLYFLEAAERFFRLDPSPFRSVVFVGLFIVVSFFVVTSSVSYIASGLVLTLFLTLLLWQFGEWSTVKQLNRWYLMVAEPVSPRTQGIFLFVQLVLFILQTIIFLKR